VDNNKKNPSPPPVMTKDEKLAHVAVASVVGASAMATARSAATLSALGPPSAATVGLAAASAGMAGYAIGKAADAQLDGRLSKAAGEFGESTGLFQAAKAAGEAFDRVADKVSKVSGIGELHAAAVRVVSEKGESTGFFKAVDNMLGVDHSKSAQVAAHEPKLSEEAMKAATLGGAGAMAHAAAGMGTAAGFTGALTAAGAAGYAAGKALDDLSGNKISNLVSEVGEKSGLFPAVQKWAENATGSSKLQQELRAELKGAGLGDISLSKGEIAHLQKELAQAKPGDHLVVEKNGDMYISKPDAQGRHDPAPKDAAVLDADALRANARIAQAPDMAKAQKVAEAKQEAPQASGPAMSM
jgi:hypothetical protein